MKQRLFLLAFFAAALGVPHGLAVDSSQTPLSPPSLINRPVVRGVHLTASAAGSKKYRQNHLEPMFAGTLINTVVVDLKEEDGHVYVPGVKMAERIGAYSAEIPDLQAWLADLKKRNIYTIARIVVFKDNKAPRRYPAWGVHNPHGELWYDRKHVTWLDPYHREAWKYNLLIALQAAKLGFEEIQFDYLRFPTDGHLTTMRLAKPYTPDNASKALVGFLEQAAQLLHPLGVKISIDVFGLTTSVHSGMGIGQRFSPMAAAVDYVCPMTYPSHYARGEYGIANPNDQPYEVIRLAMRDALRALGPAGAHKLRPYLQDFSLKGRGIRYGANEVRAQIQAAADLNVLSWTLWNARCAYSIEALRAPVTPAPPAGETTAQAASGQ